MGAPTSQLNESIEREKVQKEAYLDFLEAFAKEESGGNYDIQNTLGTAAFGKYQFRAPAFKTQGLITEGKRRHPGCLDMDGKSPQFGGI